MKCDDKCPFFARVRCICAPERYAHICLLEPEFGADNPDCGYPYGKWGAEKFDDARAFVLGWLQLHADKIRAARYRQVMEDEND